VFRAVMLFGLRWQAQRDTAFLRSASRDFANQLALKAREVTPPWKKRHGNCFAGAGQNAFVETQKPPITLAEALRIGKPSQKMRQLLECGSLLPLWNDARCCSNCSSYLYRQPKSR
jgi:hypothetical protein